LADCDPEAGEKIVRRVLLSALIFLACAAAPAPKPAPTTKPPRCTTACGMTADLDEGECGALNIAEARALKAYADLVPAFRPGYAGCVALADWHVQVRVRTLLDARLCDTGWVMPYDGDLACIVGLTKFENKTITVTNKAFAFNALAHEIGHVLEHAFDYRGPQHCAWRARGLKAAIEKVTGEKDDSEEKCYPATDGGS
jgi:hypothetical protein